MVPVMDADIMDGDDIRVLERRRGRRFRSKTMDELARGKLAAEALASHALHQEAREVLRSQGIAVPHTKTPP
jgi:hypothetical protein